MKYIITDSESGDFIDVMELNDAQVRAYKKNNPEHLLMSEQEQLTCYSFEDIEDGDDYFDDLSN